MSENLNDKARADSAQTAFLDAYYRSEKERAMRVRQFASPEYIARLRELGIRIPQGTYVAPNAFQNVLDFAHHADQAFALGGIEGYRRFIQTHVIRSRGKGKARRFSSRAALSRNKTNAVVKHSHVRENARRLTPNWSKRAYENFVAKYQSVVGAEVSEKIKEAYYGH